MVMSGEWLGGQSEAKCWWASWWHWPFATVKAGQLDNCSTYWQRQRDNSELESTIKSYYLIQISHKQTNHYQKRHKVITGSCCRRVLFSFVTQGKKRLSGNHHLTTSFSTTHHFHFIKGDSGNFSSVFLNKEKSTVTTGYYWCSGASIYGYLFRQIS